MSCHWWTSTEAIDSKEGEDDDDRQAIRTQVLLLLNELIYAFGLKKQSLLTMHATTDGIELAQKIE